MKKERRNMQPFFKKQAGYALITCLLMCLSITYLSLRINNVVLNKNIIQKLNKHAKKAETLNIKNLFCEKSDCNSSFNTMLALNRNLLFVSKVENFKSKLVENKAELILFGGKAIPIVNLEQLLLDSKSNINCPEKLCKLSNLDINESNIFYGNFEIEQINITNDVNLIFLGQVKINKLNIKKSALRIISLKQIEITDIKTEKLKSLLINSRQENIKIDIKNNAPICNNFKPLLLLAAKEIIIDQEKTGVNRIECDYQYNQEIWQESYPLGLINN